MAERLRSQMRNPWMWFATLLLAGVVLSIIVATNGTVVRTADASPAGITHACIPLMEMTTDGKLTGKVSCATDLQVKQICERFKEEDKDKK